MNSSLVKNSIRFILLVLLQVLLCSNMHLWGYVTLYPYLLFLLLLRVDISKTNLLLLGFFSGLVIDFFQNTMGMQAAASTLLVFARPAVLNFYFKKVEFAPREEPGISRLGFTGFFKYAFTLVLIHNLFLFFLEAFSLAGFFTTVERALVNSVATVVLILILEMLFSKRKKNL